MTPEHIIQNQIRLAVSASDCTIFRTNVGKVRTADGRWFDTGLPVGFPDLMGFRHSDGKLILIEVKTPTGRLRPAQKQFRDWVTQYPVLYDVCRSPDDARGLVLP